MSSSFIELNEPSHIEQAMVDSDQYAKMQNWNVQFDQTQMAQVKQDTIQAKYGACAISGYPNFPPAWMIPDPSLPPSVISAGSARPGYNTEFDFQSPFLGSKDMPANPIDEYMARMAPPSGIIAPFDDFDPQNPMPEADPFAMTSAKTDTLGPDTDNLPTELPFAASASAREVTFTGASREVTFTGASREVTFTGASSSASAKEAKESLPINQKIQVFDIPAAPQKEEDPAVLKEKRMMQKERALKSAPTSLKEKGVLKSTTAPLETAAQTNQREEEEHFPKDYAEGVRESFKNNPRMSSSQKALYIASPFLISLLILLFIGFVILAWKKQKQVPRKK